MSNDPNRDFTTIRDQYLVKHSCFRNTKRVRIARLYPILWMRHAEAKRHTGRVGSLAELWYSQYKEFVATQPHKRSVV